MEGLSVLLEKILRRTTFRGQPVNAVTKEALRASFGSANGDFHNRVIPIESPLQTSDESITELADRLRGLMTDYVDSDTDVVGHAFPVLCPSTSSRPTSDGGLVGYEQESELRDFAKGLVWHAAVLIPHRVAGILSDSMDGKPLPFRTSSLLLGVTVSQQLELNNGVRVTRLPESSDILPASLPSTTSRSVKDFLGRAVLSVDCSVCPALFHPRSCRNENEAPRYQWVLGEASLATLYEALTLVCNSYIHSIMSWSDFEELSSFPSEVYGNNPATGSTVVDNRQHTGWVRDPRTGVTTLSGGDVLDPVPVLSLEGLKEACKIHGVLDRLKKSNPRFGIAVDRWTRSMRPGLGAKDGFIELRIALEALYLDGKQGKVTFRLSTAGARHLGRDAKERTDIADKLKKFYGAASKVVHAAVSKQKKNDLARKKEQENLKLLNCARALCRRGILEVVKQDRLPDGDKLIMGHETA